MLILEKLLFSFLLIFFEKNIFETANKIKYIYILCLSLKLFL